MRETCAVVCILLCCLLMRAEGSAKLTSRRIQQVVQPYWAPAPSSTYPEKTNAHGTVDVEHYGPGYTQGAVQTSTQAKTGIPANDAEYYEASDAYYSNTGDYIDASQQSEAGLHPADSNRYPPIHGSQSSYGTASGGGNLSGDVQTKGGVHVTPTNVNAHNQISGHAVNPDYGQLYMYGKSTVSG